MQQAHPLGQVFSFVEHAQHLAPCSALSDHEWLLSQWTKHRAWSLRKGHNLQEGQPKVLWMSSMILSTIKEKPGTCSLEKYHCKWESYDFHSSGCKFKNWSISLKARVVFYKYKTKTNLHSPTKTHLFNIRIYWFSLGGYLVPPPKWGHLTSLGTFLAVTASSGGFF